MFSSRIYFEFDVRFHTRVGESNCQWFVMFYWLITKHASASALIHRQQTICWTSAQTKLTSIYRHELIVIYCHPWWNIKRYLQFRRNWNLQLSLLLHCIFFLLFGRDTLWRNPRKRVARGEKVWSPETLLHPHSGFALLGKSCYSSTYVKLGVK